MLINPSSTKHIILLLEQSAPGRNACKMFQAPSLSRVENKVKQSNILVK